jgi:hypothetical protein
MTPIDLTVTAAALFTGDNLLLPMDESNPRVFCG